DLVRGALRPASPHVPRVGAVAVENTHNAAGGKVMPAAVMAGIVAAAEQGDVRVHLDGARLWNAALALGVPLASLARGGAGVLVVPCGARRLRAVTHLDVSRPAVERAAGVISRVLSG